MKNLSIILLFLMTGFCLLQAQVITPIANIQDSSAFYQNKTVTIQGIVTIGAKKLHATQLKCYIQDSSGRGIQIFDYTCTNQHQLDFVKGYELKIKGKILDYNGTTELTSIENYEVMDNNPNTPLPFISLNYDEVANYQYWEGTRVKMYGTLTEDPYAVGGGANITLRDSLNKTVVLRVWDTTGIDYSMLSAGVPIDGYGVVSFYSNKTQLLPAYQTDLVIKLTHPVINNVSYSPANPFTDQSITATAKIMDYDGTIAYKKLFYRLESETQFDSLDVNSIGNNLFTATLPALNTITNTEDNYIFFFRAKDNEDHLTDSPLQRVVIMKRRPIITNVRFENTPGPTDSLFVLADVSDSDGSVENVRLLYRFNYSSDSHEIPMNILSGTTYRAGIPPQGAGTMIFISVWAEDDSSLVSLVDEDNNGNPYRFVYAVSSHNAVLKIAPKVYNVFAGDKIEIGYFDQSGDSAVLRIYNAEGKLVFTINTTINSTTGITFYQWDGRDKNRQFVEPGMYICHLETRDKVTGKKKTKQAPIVIGMRLK